MRKRIFLAVLSVTGFCFANPGTFAAMVRTVPDSVAETSDKAEETGGSSDVVEYVPGAKPNSSPRDKRIQRELDKEYEEGSLTRTEYIQREREFNNFKK
jgi:hypothetical protein